MEIILSVLSSVAIEPFLTALFTSILAAIILIIRDLLKYQKEERVKIRKLPSKLDSSIRLFATLGKFRMGQIERSTEEIALEHFPEKDVKKVYKILNKLKDKEEIIIVEDHEDFRQIVWTKNQN